MIKMADLKQLQKENTELKNKISELITQGFGSNVDKLLKENAELQQELDEYKLIAIIAYVIFNKRDRY